MSRYLRFLIISCFFFIAVMSARVSLLPVPVAQCAGCAKPNQKMNNGAPIAWAPNASVTVWMDPQGFNQIQYNDLKTAVDNWNANGNQPQMTLAARTAADPGATTNGTVRIVAGSADPRYIASTNTVVDGNTNHIMYATVSFDKDFKIDDGSGTSTMVNAYNPGGMNADNFFRMDMEHELGHALGLDDFHDAQGNEIDSTDPTAMGAYRGVNNLGYPQTNQPPGHMSDVQKDCDQAQVKDAEQKNASYTPPAPPPDNGSPDTSYYDGWCYYYWEYNEETYEILDYWTTC